jgi:hypothetical protein
MGCFYIFEIRPCDVVLIGSGDGVSSVGRRPVAFTSFSETPRFQPIIPLANSQGL